MAIWFGSVHGLAMVSFPGINDFIVTPDYV